MEPDFIHSLERRLKEPLPGRDAQFRMAHLSRSIYEGDAPPDAKPAGVLALFFPKNTGWHLVLIERESHNPRDRHRGQISFPGGRFDQTDRTLADTALREAEEEVGILASSVQLLGELTSLYIPVSNFHVHPFVGFVDHSPVFLPQPEEVKSILEIPFREFSLPENRGTTHISISDHLLLRDVPYFNVAGKVVWGATAMILSELLVLAHSG